ncbi:16S rRNA (guanine(527)-N(7))-methyltransferase RsmG [Rhizobium sp. SSA_523]|uniref:16S rRNA (guanine(527)-N(7))-methyltransferase RsmG n=1 Tax=Rhizobium sp. SSA_523 TaxID=2952477 RepID=UPI002091261D|nr:16S rRNA (guanine(527)-N(7))-methyltransferase RsmG [Rhizobium sp. SSA_523]MCO5734614.1 16S rRNA (guanine(527)-N(7))-methyltransferase RsmG [Rhizobium sp. SSA_523]WKC23390.1 16S rRNA (guanine(527)-N(7))-methyltransferase RsmG [Rhizobium sp. SSA_523]
MKLNGISVSRETEQRLTAFEALFRRWAKAINLVAPSTKGDLWQRHIADSAQIFQLSPRPQTWIDLGSGGGFPGIITAILLTELNDGWVHLVESNQKKASFLRTALLETGARGTVHAVRIEEASAQITHCDCISARALADLSSLLNYCAPWMTDHPEVRAYLHKGRDYAAEIKKADSSWSFDLIQHRSAIEDDSVILEISDLRRKD